VRRVDKYCTTPKEPVEDFPQGLEPDRLIGALGELDQALKEQRQVWQQRLADLLDGAARPSARVGIAPPARPLPAKGGAEAGQGRRAQSAAGPREAPEAPASRLSELACFVTCTSAAGVSSTL